MKNKLLLFLSVMTLSLSNLWGQDTYTQISTLAELTDGDYLVVGDGTTNDGIMLNQQNATGDNTFIIHTTVTNPGTSIDTGFTADNVFSITVDSNQITIYNASVGYVTYRGTGNHASFFNGTPTNSEKWTFAVADGLWTLTNVNSTDRILQWNNGSPRFAAYTSNQIKLKLYKKVETEPSGYIISVTQPTGGSISPEGEVEVEEGGTATFTATPESDCYTFSHWVVDDENAGNTNPYVFTNVTANHTITAVFDVNSYTISATAGANGTITPNGEVEVVCGENQSFTITADAGFEIADVLVDGISVGAVLVYTFTEVTENHTISATFEEITEPGEVCGTEDFESTEIPAGYSDGEFTNNGITWIYGHSRNEGLGTGDDYSIEGKGLMLRRASDSYLETTLTSGVGEFTFEYRKAFTGGNERQLEVIVNGTQMGTTPIFGNSSGDDPTVYTFSIVLDIEGEVTIRIKNVGETTTNRQAVIDNISWTCLDTEPCVNTITATAGANGTITPNGEVEVVCGENQSFIITADAGFEIEDVLVDGISVGAVAEYTFTEVTENHTISVTFEEISEPGEVCGTEDFESTEIPAGYSDGEFTNNGITWIYGHSRNEGLGTGDDYSIEGKGLMLRRASDSYLETTLTSGVGEFTFEYRKAFTGGNERQLEVIVNGTQMGTTPIFGNSSGDDPTVYTFSIVLDIEGEVTIRIKNVGETTTNRQAVIDNISWTCLDTEPCVNTITATAGANGTITPNGDVSVECGADQSFTIEPEIGYIISDVLVDDVSVGAVASYTFTDVNENHTISVTFEEDAPSEFCFEEGFTNLTEIATGTTYSDGTYTNNEITWTFAHAQSPIDAGSPASDYSIDGQGVLLRRASDSYLEATIPAGVGVFSFEYRKAYTGGNERQLELMVDGVQVAVTPVFGAGSGEDPTVYTFSYEMNTETSTLVRIKLTGETTTNRHTTIDNIAWTCFDVEPCDVPAPIAIGTFEFVAGETLADLEDSLEFTGELTWYDDEELTIVLPDTTLVEDAGVYYVTQTVDGCESDALRVETDELGLDSNELANFSFYPNPVKDILTISNSSKIQKVEIYNLNGNLVWTKSIQGNQAALNLESLSSGVYVMKISTEKETKSVKILKK